MNVYTIGHSTRSADELSDLLREHEIKLLADIRRYPGSKRYPHFASEAMAQWLPKHGVAYIHMPELGGRRKALADSRNTAWRNEQFRAYADYMATDEFRDAIDKLLSLAENQRVSIMCAEAVPWRCHRNLVADELTRRGIEVLHIIGTGAVKVQAMNPLAQVEEDHLVYPGEQQTLRL
ncbi:MAG TPA: DUF488 domain-containing protein [Thermoanaerobaculia bacterium]|jgi:uncharacterized protein (DUF488 family)|nr:DUF488 domain-containing protein [Thermoanaerobaculia bacterium]